MKDSFSKAMRGLKPETIRMLKTVSLLLAALYILALAIYAAGNLGWLEYQLSMMLSEQLVMGFRRGFGMLCIGFLLAEAK
ncbi:MAG: hypothetical protein FWH26_11510 [Oscillospiraceae bacterium]|nr:hypothetical protein [Oscillospiraceae bacterium]